MKFDMPRDRDNPPPEVFISYAHADNVGFGDSPGFVTKFCEYIETVGRFKRGKPIELFRDTRMASGTDWSDEIKASLASAVIFLPILSPSWENSNYCDLEFQSFQESFPQYATIGLQKPVFPVLFETRTERITSNLRKLQIRYRFAFNMTDTEFRNEADRAVDELVERLNFFTAVRTAHA